jgi:hypothetical protein
VGKVVIFFDSLFFNCRVKALKLTHFVPNLKIYFNLTFLLILVFYINVLLSSNVYPDFNAFDVSFLEKLASGEILLSIFVPIKIYSNAPNLGILCRYLNTKRLTNLERNSYSVPQNLHEVIIGCSLGDLHIRKQVNNALLQFEQGLIHEAYIIHLFDLFKDYCSSTLKYRNRKPDLKTGKINSSIYFRTYSLPCLNFYHDLFYVNGVKRIPLKYRRIVNSYRFSILGNG